ncbi:MAG: hypothetical protein ACXW3U_15795 [Rhodoplanes sp.]
MQIRFLVGNHAGMTPDEAQQLTAHPVRALDLAWPSRPPRTLRRAPTAQPTVLIESVCRRPRVVDRIVLAERDAAQRLSRYALAQER